MTEEQGKATKILERLNFLIIDLKSTKKVNEIVTEEGKFNLVKDIETVLNIIKEKDKRIKELEEEKNNSIPKQKIKDKIKELANTRGDLATYIAVSERIKVLEELLEEKQ